MRGPALSPSEARAHLTREIHALTVHGVSVPAAVRVVAARIGSTPEKVAAVASRR